ncbi:MAG: ATPase [Firmicutes bacterium]|nr:ATPase [Bacillota bacterium]
MDRGHGIQEVEYLLDQLEAIVKQGRRLPWGHLVVVDPEAIRAVLDHIRHALPEVLKEAEWVVQERDRLMQEAAQEADQVVREARSRAEALAGDSEIWRAAKARADDLIAEAERRAQEIHRGALSYADDVLAALEQELDKMAMTVRQNRESLKPRRVMND